jgi:SAM-dependent methyltransferase
MRLWQRLSNGLSLRWALEHHGLVGSARWLAHSLPYHIWLRLFPGGRRELAFDSLNAVRTEGIVQPWQLDIQLPLDQRNEIVHYAPSRPRRFYTLIKKVRVDYSNFIFVDIGCGKGRALLLAARLPFKHIVGIEFSPVLADIARANVSHHVDRCEIICADACYYKLPPEPLVVYLFNPFVGSLFDRFVSNLEASIRAVPRPVYIAYTSPFCEARLAASPLFTRLAGRQHLFAVYAHAER